MHINFTIEYLVAGDKKYTSRNKKHVSKSKRQSNCHHLNCTTVRFQISKLTSKNYKAHITLLKFWVGRKDGWPNYSVLAHTHCFIHIYTYAPVISTFDTFKYLNHSVAQYLPRSYPTSSTDHFLLQTTLFKQSTKYQISPALLG